MESEGLLAVVTLVSILSPKPSTLNHQPSTLNSDPRAPRVSPQARQHLNPKP
jgi:hypothetical protein